jgi:hypothetical protein
MKPIYQNVTSPSKGDCTAACIASILEVPLESIPNFNLPDGSHYYINLRKWVENSGVAFVEYFFRKTISLDNLPYDVNIHPVSCHGAYCLLSVPSQKYKNGWHHVVGRMFYETEDYLSGRAGIEIIHDPNINNKPYKKDVEVRSITFLVPNK